MSHKICSFCLIEKTVEEFSLVGRSRVVRQPKCKTCVGCTKRKCVKVWREKNPEQNSVSDIHTKLRRKYGLEPKDFHRMFDEQLGKCMICGLTLSWAEGDKRVRPHVDHNHETGQVRSLLCLTCNTGLGMFQDNPELLTAASQYLLSWQRERLSEVAPSEEG